MESLCIRFVLQLNSRQDSPDLGDFFDVVGGLVISPGLPMDLVSLGLSIARRLSIGNGNVMYCNVAN